MSALDDLSSPTGEVESGSIAATTLLSSLDGDESSSGTSEMLALDDLPFPTGGGDDSGSSEVFSILFDTSVDTPLEHSSSPIEVLEGARRFL